MRFFRSEASSFNINYVFSLILTFQANWCILTYKKWNWNYFYGKFPVCVSYKKIVGTRTIFKANFPKVNAKDPRHNITKFSKDKSSWLFLKRSLNF